jgi:hypothetical protein
MKQPIPRITEPPEELKRLLTTEADVQKHQRLQALYLLRTPQACTRQQVAQLLAAKASTSVRRSSQRRGFLRSAVMVGRTSAIQGSSTLRNAGEDRTQSCRTP